MTPGTGNRERAMGLTVHKEGKAPRFDMVLIHGLAGNGLSTWEHEDGTFWPTQLDRIPDALKEPRVLVFQYLTRFSRPFQSQSLSSQSEKLLQQLSQQRGDTLTRLRPIIFVGHNTGGIIIKKALLAARSDPRYRDILHLTYGVIFFATPHRGLRDAYPDRHDSSEVWKETVARLYEANTLRSRRLKSPQNTTLLHDEDARNLRRISGDFAKFIDCSGFSVVSFTEGAVDEYLGERIVNESSAKLDIQNELVFPLLERDHFQLCRFSKSDPTTAQVWSCIDELVTRSPKSRYLTSRNIQRLLSLGVFVIRPTQKSPRPTHGTCRWIEESQAFSAWRAKDPFKNKLWIHGDGGCGKTNLARHILGLLADSAMDTVVYCSLDDIREGHKTSGKVLLCLLHEIFLARPELIANCLGYTDRGTQGEPTNFDTQRLDDIAWLWHEAMNFGTRRNHHLTLIIDGFDQCTDREGVQQAFLRIITSVDDSGTRLGNERFRVLVLSRQPITAVSRDLSHAFSTYHITSRVTEADIGVIVRKRVGWIAETSGIDKPLQQRMCEDIAKAAAGMHVLANIVVGEVQKNTGRGSSQQEILAVLDTLPRGMIGIYESALAKVSAHGDRPFVKNLLFWLAYQARPLEEEELKTGLMMIDAVDKASGDRRLLPQWPLWRVRPRDAEDRAGRYMGLTTKISRACGELVRILPGGAFELAHRSLGDYLAESPTTLTQKYPSAVHHKHYHEAGGEGLMARLCTEYLLLDYFSDAGQPRLPTRSREEGERWEFKLRDRLASRPLCRYAAMHWLLHASFSDPDFVPKLEAQKPGSDRHRLLDLEGSPHAVCWSEVMWYCSRPQVEGQVEEQEQSLAEEQPLANMVSQVRLDEQPRQRARDQHRQRGGGDGHGGGGGHGAGGGHNRGGGRQGGEKTSGCECQCVIL